MIKNTLCTEAARYVIELSAICIMIQLMYKLFVVQYFNWALFYQVLSELLMVHEENRKNQWLGCWQKNNCVKFEDDEE